MPTKESRLNEFKRHFLQSNFCEMYELRNKIYYNATEAEKKEFFDEIAKYSLEIRTASHGDWEMLFLYKDGQMLDNTQLRKIGFLDGVIEPERKEYPQVKFFKSEIFDTYYKDKLGWLSPKGGMLYGDWGEHTNQAFEIVKEEKWDEEYKEYERSVYSENVRDFITYKGYVLIDCPECNGHLKVNYCKLNKKQRDFLIDLFMEIKDSDIVNKLVEKEV